MLDRLKPARLHVQVETRAADIRSRFGLQDGASRALTKRNIVRTFSHRGGNITRLLGGPQGSKCSQIIALQTILWKLHKKAFNMYTRINEGISAAA